ncbi:hypothetical protein P153DRAFT_381154 [Dothidotthia symphoricarpi CBS 119687]|uniref:Protein-S-isoprenylcysteine O-methyltransferase n=1 Tax=Dothidotthia symphoricarpi CBS 119687 TaxID=1392245 RepID=A0A6A6ARZ6_9PLEO|nr:uncharacterized protein P153DRAFT_381154 [Dothidotthia symphoricarpi CBS 119687]KAF2133983.1 hypothetical protein P153DRAFT_381154 [Dothidotthia symphoricarpi CBS 119687]
MDAASILFALAILHTGYRIQLCFREPSDKEISLNVESWFPRFATSPIGLVVVRTAVVCTCLYHVVISLAPPSTLHQVCPQSKYLDPKLFMWSKTTVASLLLAYAGSYVRFQAYAQLGQDFTYRLAKPDGLVTGGIFTYVRHPSYTGLFAVLVALQSLLLRQRGLISCFNPEWMTTDERVAYIIPTIQFSVFILLFMVARVADEEKMMEEEFGQTWRDYCAKTKKFIPFVV